MWLLLTAAMPNGVLQLRRQVSMTKSHHQHCSLTIHHSSDIWVKKGLNPVAENEGAGGHQGKTRQGGHFFAVVTVVDPLTKVKLRKQED
jgi:hypothetical protein